MVQSLNVVVHSSHVAVQSLNVVVHSSHVVVQSLNVGVHSSHVVVQLLNVGVQSSLSLLKRVIAIVKRVIAIVKRVIAIVKRVIAILKYLLAVVRSPKSPLLCLIKILNCFQINPDCLFSMIKWLGSLLMRQGCRVYSLYLAISSFLW